MIKYETIFYIVGDGADIYDCGEKAQDLPDLRVMDRGIVISLGCEQLAKGEIKSPCITEELDPAAS